jgi:hypothetical protein
MRGYTGDASGIIIDTSSGKRQEVSVIESVGGVLDEERRARIREKMLLLEAEQKGAAAEGGAEGD